MANCFKVVSGISIFSVIARPYRSSPFNSNSYSAADWRSVDLIKDQVFGFTQKPILKLLLFIKKLEASSFSNFFGLVGISVSMNSSPGKYSHVLSACKITCSPLSVIAFCCAWAKLIASMHRMNNVVLFILAMVRLWLLINSGRNHNRICCDYRLPVKYIEISIQRE